MKSYLKEAMVGMTTVPQYSHIRLSKKCSIAEHYKIIKNISSNLKGVSIKCVRDGFHLTGYGDYYTIQVTPCQIEISCIPDEFYEIETILRDFESTFGFSLNEFRIEQLGLRVCLMTNHKEANAALEKLTNRFDKEEIYCIEQFCRDCKPALFFNASLPDFFYRNSDKRLDISTSQWKLSAFSDFRFLTFELSFFRRFPIRIRNKSVADFIKDEELFRREFLFHLYKSYMELRKRNMKLLASTDSDFLFYIALDREFQNMKEIYGW